MNTIFRWIAMKVAGSVLLYVQYIIHSFRDSLTGYMHSGKGLCSTWCTVSDSTITVLYLIIVVLI